jgi:Holliday junction resolvasome RuvABC DNA-binding subunit
MDLEDDMLYLNGKVQESEKHHLVITASTIRYNFFFNQINIKRSTFEVNGTTAIISPLSYAFK